MRIKRNPFVFLAGVLVGILFHWFYFTRYPLLNDPVRRGNYAYGQHMGENLLSQKIRIKPNIIAAAMLDVQAGTSRLTKEEKTEAIQALQQEGAAARIDSNPLNEKTPPVESTPQ